MCFCKSALSMGFLFLSLGVLSAAENVWVEVKLPQILPAGRKGSVAGTNWGGVAYRSANHSLLVYDRYTGEEYPYAIYANAMTAWELNSNVMRVHKITDTAPLSRHTYEVWTYVDEKDAIYTMKGAHRGCEVMDDGREVMWKYTFNDNTWKPVTTVVPIVNGCEGKTMYWKAGNRLLFIDGGGKGIHEFDLATETAWKPVTSTNPPGNFVYGGTSTWDTKRDQWVFYSGKLAELRVYNPQTRVFSNLPAVGDARPPLSIEGSEPHRIGITYIPNSDEYVIASQKTGTWAFDLATRTWRQVTTDTVMKLTRNTYLWYDPATSILYGLCSEPNYRYKMEYRKSGMPVRDGRKGMLRPQPGQALPGLVLPVLDQASSLPDAGTLGTILGETRLQWNGQDALQPRPTASGVYILLPPVKDKARGG